ncbi:hypothetical protein [Flavimarina sp. Hel_I_48]|uniref:hypothetical protein n=1 Tax=Flavimarina sp. Hel_I_48 TaxID=1392488 RepID=UPI0004DEEF6D|nr:hypothetical protein [Flavimarina sp. Hel_I_48]
MKYLSLLLITLLFSFTDAKAQAANDIVEKYIEQSGGRNGWDTLRATKMDATLQQADILLPLTLYNTKSGKQAIMIDFAGKRFAQMAFDGQTYWTTDLTTMIPLLGSQALTDNIKLSLNDFPSPVINYEQNYYQLEYEGIETVDSVQTFKIKIIKEPMTVEGRKVENVSFYYFNTQNFNPVKIIEMKPNGDYLTSELSDYQKVQGFSFPFTIKQGDMLIKIKNINLNPQIDGKIFEFPQSDY